MSWQSWFPHCKTRSDVAWAVLGMAMLSLMVAAAL
jgi:hypothetical protein